MCCHLADLSLKRQLQGNASSQDKVLHALFDTLADHLPSLPSPSIGAVLWSIASVQQDTTADSSLINSSNTSNTSNTSNWKAEAIEQVALLEGGCGKVAKYNTKELVNILFSVGALQQHSSPSQAVVVYSTELMEQLAVRMESTPYVKGSLSPSDFTDLVSVCARMFVNNNEKEKESVDRDEQETAILPPAALQLMNLVAGEVRRQLANRASSRAAFLPRELTRFLTNFASLEMRNNANVDGLFDIISGFIVDRVRAKHLNAVSRPDDFALVLSAYAKQQHRSVSVPELLTAVGEQLRRNAAQMQERYTVATAKEEQERTQPLEGGPPDLRCSFPAIISILQSHKSLGYAIDPLTLTALLPGIKRGLATASAEEVLKLLELFVVFEFKQAGPKILELLLARLEDLSADDANDETLQTARALVAALSS
jgi:hypothetical protein